MKNLHFSALAVAVMASAAQAAPRDVQMRSINFATGVVELHNFGAAAEPLNAWQFCTHDEDQSLNYSLSSGLNGESVPAGGSLYIHYNNDAAGAGHINLSSIGGLFALPLDEPGAFSIALYFPPVAFFVDGNQIADHIQWSTGGLDNLIADERSDEAEAGGVWTNQSVWIATSASTTYIRLNDTTGGVLHGPADYDVLDTMPDCNANGLDDVLEIQDGTAQDNNGDLIPDSCGACSEADLTTQGAGMGDPDFGVPDGLVTGADINFYVNLWVVADLAADITTQGAGMGDPGFGVPDGLVTGADINFYVNLWVAGCP